MNLKFVVVYENISEPKFNIGHCRVKIKVTLGFQKFPHLQQLKFATCSRGIFKYAWSIYNCKNIVKL